MSSFTTFVGGSRASAVFNGPVAGVLTSPLSFAGVSFGADTPGRHVIIGMAYRAQVDSDVTGGTIGGQAATKIIQHSGTGVEHLEFWRAQPSGTSGTVSFTVSGSPTYAAIGSWAVYGLKSTTLIDSQEGMGSQSITANARGFVLAISGGGESPGDDIVWTLSGLTSNSEVVITNTLREERLFASNNAPGASLSYSINNDSDFPGANQALAISLR
jgi:hypothetical protein